MDTIDATFRKYVFTEHSIGSGANMTTARKIVAFLQWLDIVAETHLEIAKLWSQAIHFVLANTHAGSLEDAREIIEDEVNSRDRAFALSIEYHEMAFNLTKGYGSPNQKIGMRAIEQYMPQAEAVINNCYVYIPVATVGSGNTGGNAIVPLVAAGVKAKCWVSPFIILSAKEELDDARLAFQQRTLAELYKIPVWCTVADNGYLAETQDEWNNMPMQTAYNRIDFVAAHELRTRLMMFTCPNQIDEGKMREVIYNGPGGYISVAAADINEESHNPHEEIIRAVRLTTQNPFKIERIGQNGENTFADAIEVLVTGVMGGVSAPFERLCLEQLKEQPFLKNTKKPLQHLHQRFAPYLPTNTASFFVLMTRKRPGHRLKSLPFPPRNHPVLKALRQAENRALAGLGARTLGRSLDDAVQQPVSLPEVTPSTVMVVSPIDEPETVAVETTTVIEEIPDTLVPEVSEPIAATVAPPEPPPILPEAIFTAPEIPQITPELPEQPEAVLVSANQPEAVIAVEEQPKSVWKRFTNVFRRGFKQTHVAPQASSLPQNGNGRVNIPAPIVTDNDKELLVAVPIKSGKVIVGTGEDFLKKYPTAEDRIKILTEKSIDQLKINIRDANDILQLIEGLPSVHESGSVLSSEWWGWFRNQLRSEGITIPQECKVDGSVITPSTATDVLERLLQTTQSISTNDRQSLRALYIIRMKFGYQMVHDLLQETNGSKAIMTPPPVVSSSRIATT